MINTLNETHLHKTLKRIYANKTEGSVMEQPAEGYIADIIRPDGEIIEIQTGSLSSLLPKITKYLAAKRNVTVVYPLAAKKYIETKKDGCLISRRKSPVSKNIYSIFKELTGLTSVLLDPKFTLIVHESTITEEREQTELCVQSKNNRRRFRKNWLKTGKRLEDTGTEHIFNCTRSYLNLIPKDLPQMFCVKDLLLCAKKNIPGIKENEIICIGDSENDLSMIQNAGFGIAMGNARKDVKEAAKYITDNNECDGVGKAIEKIVLGI
mgnify:CR=1 FL=1